MEVFSYIRENVSALEAAKRYGCNILKYNKMLCISHSEKTPSLSFKGQNFHCFGCGIGGSSIDFVMYLFNIDKIAAVKKINEDFNLGLKIGGLTKAEANKMLLERKKYKETQKRLERFNAAYNKILFTLFDLEKEYQKVISDFTRNSENEFAMSLLINRLFKYQVKIEQMLDARNTQEEKLILFKEYRKEFLELYEK